MWEPKRHEWHDSASGLAVNFELKTVLSVLSVAKYMIVIINFASRDCFSGFCHFSKNKWVHGGALFCVGTLLQTHALAYARIWRRTQTQTNPDARRHRRRKMSRKIWHKVSVGLHSFLWLTNTEWATTCYTSQPLAGSKNHFCGKNPNPHGGVFNLELDKIFSINISLTQRQFCTLSQMHAFAEQMHASADASFCKCKCQQFP